MRAIGFYHSHTPRFGELYKQQVVRAAYRLFTRSGDG